MGIAVLGPLQVDGGTDALARRDRVVLAVLAVRAGDVVPADQLADALWAEGPPPTWTKALQGTVVRLRKLLGAPTIETVGHGYRLALPPSDIDAHEFERLVGRARELLEIGEPDRAAYVVGRPLNCGGVRRWPTSRNGSPDGRRPTGWRSCAAMPRSCASMPRSALAGTATS